MAAKRGMWLMITVIILFSYWVCESCDGCWEQDKVALLQLKDFLVQQDKIEFSRSGFPADEFVPPLNNWAAKEDCCRWEEVECDNTTGRVTNLRLYSISSNFGSSDHLRYWNMSLFLPFEGLQKLDLTANQLGGFVQNGGLGKLRGLRNLQVLDLGNNNFNESILSSFSAGFSSLKSLNLARTNLSTSTCYITSLCSLRHLQQLDLSGNYMRGGLPLCFSNMTSLEDLDLSYNRLSGDIASSSPIRMMTSIRYLDLSNNLFRVPSSFGPFFNLSKLQFVDLGSNIIYQDTELQPSSSVPKFQLQTLRVACCGDAGFVPEFLSHQTHLQYVSLSSLSLKGEFPTWVLENNTNLETLDLSNNSLSGPFKLFPKLPTFSSQVYILDISSNSLDGHIPAQIGANLPEMDYLNMSNNLLEGTIPTSFGYMKSLASLDLSKNSLSGAVPEPLTAGCYSLQVLRLSNNNLQGHTFPENFNLTTLEELILDGNHFTGIGRIPIGPIDWLTRLDISNNQLSGRIPTWIGNISRLAQLVMANNYLEGPIPLELCKLDGLKIMDLSSNNFSGSLPSCLTPSGINHLHLSKNGLKGSLTHKFCNSSMLVTLDLSNNQFSGTIPRCINKFPQLSYLFLNNNGLHGRIPGRLCQLEKLSMFDLSHNNLSGRIPPCLKITTLSDVSGYDEDYYAPSPVASVPIDALPITFVPPAPPSFSIEGPIEFTTKSISQSYKGKTITFMSGIDLSCNNLSGEIPQELGSLNKRLHALNLSHNSLTGQIPMTFSNLEQIESLDLSFNRLSGSIPPQIVELHFLEVLNISYNNLSGHTPQRVAQFATFDDNSYKGNPLLCGEPLQRCVPGTVKPRNPAAETGEDSDLSDMNMFYISLGVSYTVALLATVTVLWVNPYWRRAWFYYVDEVSSSCYYFVLDHLPKKIF